MTMRREEVRRDCVSRALRLRGESGREARELQVRECQRVERVNARRAGSRERDSERSGIDEDEAQASDRHGDARNALRAQRDQAELVTKTG